MNDSDLSAPKTRVGSFAVSPLLVGLALAAGAADCRWSAGPTVPASSETATTEGAATEGAATEAVTTEGVEERTGEGEAKTEGAATEAVTAEVAEERTGEGEFVLVRAGSFRMGSPADEEGRWDAAERHVDVTLTRDFHLGRYEVTQGQYEAVMGTTPSGFADCGAMCPVESVSWFDAVRFTNRLNERVGLPACYDEEGRVVGGGTVYECEGYRLPTEAEWEYAARAGTTGARHGALSEVAWYDRNSGDRTHPVGGKQPNAWGLYDMLGNVWEWTDTWYRDASSETTDPVGPSIGTDRVLRGGSWFVDASIVRSARRNPGTPGYRAPFVGFRLARSH